MSITTTVVSGITENTSQTGGVITVSGGDYFPITDRLLMNRFQLYKASLQRITANVKSKTGLKPLQLFVDSNQSNKQFLLTSFRYRPASDMYSVELNEYDNTTEITLNIEE